MVAAVGDAGTDVSPTITAMRRLLLACALLLACTAHAKLPFLENDYAAAVARAKAKDVPIFVDAWAPW
jgi:outer membrane biogenesis lipoprotein LolB